MAKTANDLTKGESAKVKGYSDQALGSRLMTLGINIENTITLVRKSPLGDAVYLKLEHQCIAIRRSEAEAIIL